jgi:L-seryl-tRNA(Ser) seleniumtransferase
MYKDVLDGTGLLDEAVEPFASMGPTRSRALPGLIDSPATMAGTDAPPPLQRLPSVDELLRSEAAAELLARYPRWAVVEAVRSEIARQRASLRQGVDDPGAGRTQLLAELGAGLRARVEALVLPALRPTLNATGVVLHTNLGRAPLARRAQERVQAVSAGYSTLEYDPEGRGRGSRQDHLQTLLTSLTGAEAAAVVNNNAGAVLVALAALAAGRQVVVSRGELVEIGGGFRIPDVMRASGARLVEVGTTNKTRLSDYLDAITAETAALLKVHRSNFALVGFTAEVAVAELADARPAGLPLLVDLGSGALVDLAPFGLPGEPTVDRVLQQGADLVTFSGDKLLGGPQAGILVGRRLLIERVWKHPLTRALRPDKLSLAALEATLELYREGTALEQIPTLRMLTAPLPRLEARKDGLLAALRAADLPLQLGARQLRSAVGGGALPLAEPETWAVTVRHPDRSADLLAAQLSAGPLPLVARIFEDAVVLDVRTLEDDELPAVVAQLARICALSPPRA